ncbi:DCL family protein [Devosia sp. XJ19-1]|uniref:DCL family protein n=1 Tax=Devosia ureilytica TaxID=2952754 RepID=A0A9Q4FTV9_9HYPH|nr:DCL family protein [Devosia ureilytica]MCP8884500.1 DCL family protein [Devosia ureilytica]MCP8888130.1 DCL family protein [Devosia ureilytica]
MSRGHPVVLSNGSKWPNKTVAKAYFRALRDRWGVGVVIDDPIDHENLCALLERYDEVIATGPSKVGCGIRHFETRENVSHGGLTIGFWVIRTDDSETDFSFMSAVDGQPRNPDAEFVEACREAVYERISEAKREFFRKHADGAGRLACTVTGELVSAAAARVDYIGKSLRDIAWDFRVSEGWGAAVPQGVISPPADAQVSAQFADMDAMIRFRFFHDRNARMRVVSKSALPSRLAATRNMAVETPLMFV